MFSITIKINHKIFAKQVTALQTVKRYQKMNNLSSLNHSRASDICCSDLAFKSFQYPRHHPRKFGEVGAIINIVKETAPYNFKQTPMLKIKEKLYRMQLGKLKIIVLFGYIFCFFKYIFFGRFKQNRIFFHFQDVRLEISRYI